MTRMITEWGSVVLVLSAAVLVIVIDARATGWAGMARAGFTTKPTEITEGGSVVLVLNEVVLVLSAAVLGSVARGV